MGYAVLELKENDNRGYYFIAKEIKENKRNMSQKEFEELLGEILIEVDEKKINRKT